MTTLSKRAAKALEVLKAGGCSVAKPEYRGTYYTLWMDPSAEPLDGFGRRGYAKAARRELIDAGFRFDEEMDGRNYIAGRLVETTEVAS
jgi:hypothetical protein